MSMVALTQIVMLEICLFQQALTNEMLNKLEYTEMCINETMRKYPAAFR